MSQANIASTARSAGCPPLTQAGEPDHIQYLTFVLSGEVFAIGILVIKEIMEYANITAVPMTPAFWRSLKGWVVDAKYRLRTSSGLWLVRQSRDASTAMVIESSSQLAIERSPLARPRRPAANHLLAS